MTALESLAAAIEAGTIQDDGFCALWHDSRHCLDAMSAYNGSLDAANARLWAAAPDLLTAYLASVEENERLRESNGILEDALQEAGDDYPGSSMQQWAQQQVAKARQALKPKEPKP